MTAQFKITKRIAAKVLKTVDAGLVHGLGNAVPGEMCVEAAVCYALGLPHSDDPGCVSPALRALKIALNDTGWSTPSARAKGMRRLAILQLGTAGVLDDKEFTARVIDMTIRVIVPRALRSAASVQTTKKHKKAMEASAARCETEGTKEAAAYAAANATYATAANAANAAYAHATYAATYAAATYAAATYAAATAAAANAAAAAATAAAAKDSELEFFAEEVVKILIEMKVPAVKWLALTEV